MKSISKAALLASALTVGSLASQVQAHTIIRFLPKSGIPYSVPHEEPRVAVNAPASGHAKTKHATRDLRTANKAKVIR